LEREAESLEVRDHVVFRNQFVELPELCRYLQASDVYITPYLHEAQITSGTLAYAMGSGAAPVSTPYWYAKELLAEGRGHLFDFNDPDGLGDVLRSLLGNPDEMARSQRRAYAFSRRMLWAQVGTDYVELARQVAREAAAPGTRALGRRSLPELRLEHLIRMTDDTGLFQHAVHSVPDRRFGYCVDDNARALIVTLLARRANGSGDSSGTERLITTYLSYLHGLSPQPRWQAGLGGLRRQGAVGSGAGGRPGAGRGTSSAGQDDVPQGDDPAVGVRPAWLRAGDSGA
jgi:hypothetical protein